MADPLDQVRALTRGLFGDHLGIRLIEASPEGATGELVVRDELCTTPGVMHGGAMMGLADHLGGIATFLNLPPGAGTTTIESKTNFFAPGRTGETVRGECRPLHRGKRTMVWQTRISGPEGRLLALVTQTQIVLEARQSPQDVLASLFAGKTPSEQKALLATLERGGAAVYRALAEQETDPQAKQALLDAARREEENAATLEAQA